MWFCGCGSHRKIRLTQLWVELSWVVAILFGLLFMIHVAIAVIQMHCVIIITCVLKCVIFQSNNCTLTCVHVTCQGVRARVLVPIIHLNLSIVRVPIWQLFLSHVPCDILTCVFISRSIISITAQHTSVCKI